MNDSPRLPAGKPSGGVSMAAFPITIGLLRDHGHALPQSVSRRGRSEGAQRAMSQVSHLELDPLDSAVPSARKHAEDVMCEWGFDDEFVHVAELLLSELTTNAGAP